MATIGILELKYHTHLVYYMSRIADPGANDVRVFTTREIADKLSDWFGKRADGVRWVLKEPEESRLSFLRRVERICDTSVDLLVMNTVVGPIRELLEFLQFTPECRQLV